MNFANVKSITIPEGKVKKIILGEGAGYTNLFSTSGSGFVQESDTEFLTNWMPYDRNDNNGKGTMYHFKGLTASNSPYKVHWATDANGTSASALAYCKNSDTPPTTSDYDVNVKIYQHHSGSDTHKFIQFEIRETVPDDFVITANEPIEAGGVVLWEAPEEGLPSIYQQVEWIQNSVSSATAGSYLNLGFAFDTAATFYINYIPSSSSSGYLFGAAENSGVLRCMVTENTSKITLYGSTGSTYNSATSAFYNGDTTIKCVLKNGLIRIENLSNNKSGESTSQKAYTMTSNLFLFAQNYNGSARVANAGTKLKAFSYYDKTDTLICDLVPCYRKADGVIGMYDLVRRTFLTNVGSGTFTKGADV